MGGGGRKNRENPKNRVIISKPKAFSMFSDVPVLFAVEVISTSLEGMRLLGEPENQNFLSSNCELIFFGGLFHSETTANKGAWPNDIESAFPRAYSFLAREK